MMARWDLSDVQVEAILNMRLRTLRRLEEIAIAQGARHAGDRERRARSAARQRQAAMARARQGGRRDREGIRRRHRRSAAAAPRSAQAPAPVEIPAAALVEREPVTVLCSQKGWIRAVKGHNVAPPSRNTRKATGRALRSPAETTDRLMIFGSNGRFYTLGGRPAARRARAGRAAAADDRPAERARHRRDVPAPAGPEAAGRRRATGAALSSTATRRWRRPAPASRC